MIEFHFGDYACGYGDIIVSNYTSGDYEGSGEALVLKNNEIEYHNLGHCSCYGPFDNGCSTYTIEQFLELQKYATTEWNTDIGNKFEELLTQYLNKKNEVYNQFPTKA